MDLDCFGLDKRLDNLKEAEAAAFAAVSKSPALVDCSGIDFDFDSDWLLDGS